MEEKYTLHLGSIPGNLTKEELHSELSKIVRVDKLDLKMKDGSESMNIGYGMVRVSTDADKRRLLDFPLEIRGRVLRVSPMYEGEELKQVRERYRRRTVYLKQLPDDCSDSELAQLFALAFGPVEKAFRLVQQSTLTKKNFGNVVFVDEAAAGRAITAKSINFKNSQILICEHKKNRADTADYTSDRLSYQEMAIFYQILTEAYWNKELNSSQEDSRRIDNSYNVNHTVQYTHLSNQTTTISTKSHHNFASLRFSHLPDSSSQPNQWLLTSRNSHGLSSGIGSLNVQHSVGDLILKSDGPTHWPKGQPIDTTKPQASLSAKREALNQCKKIEENQKRSNIVFRIRSIS
jgi:RNA recognition motif-containing protein